jgi:transcriptional regulator GlxA family with amidase domain
MERRADMTPPRQVVVLVLDGALPMDVGIPAQIFRERPESPYRMIMAGPESGEVEAAGGFRFAVDHGLETLEACDTIVVPGYADTRQAISPEVTGALRAAYDRGTRIASVCTGAFALAAADLLDGRRATTHWASADELARRYPSIRVDRDVLFVDEGQVLTSAGVAAGIDLCLHLIRRDFGVRVSNDIARHIVAAPYRSGGQAQYIPRTLPEDADDAFARTREWALTRLHEDLTVRDLAQHAHVSYRTFSRRFVEDTGHTPLQWLLRARIDVARELLEATDLGIDHIAARTGLGTGTNLRLHFQRLLGTTPSQYRKSFSGRQPERQPPDQNLRRRLASDSPCRMPSSTAAGMADRSMRLIPNARAPASSALITSTADPLSVSAAISLSSCPAGVKRVFWPLVAATAPSREMISTRSCPRARSAFVPDRIPPSM